MTFHFKTLWFITHTFGERISASKYIIQNALNVQYSVSNALYWSHRALGVVNWICSCIIYEENLSEPVPFAHTEVGEPFHLSKDKTIRPAKNNTTSHRSRLTCSVLWMVRMYEWSGRFCNITLRASHFLSFSRHIENHLQFRACFSVD